MKKFLIIATFISILGTGCDDTNKNLLSSEKQISGIDINIKGMNALGDSAWYEGWLTWLEKSAAGEIKKTLSVGLLDMNTAGELVLSKKINTGYLQGGLTLLITIEEDTVHGFQVTPTDTLEGPGEYHIIATTITANYSIFSVGDPILLNFNFYDVDGIYILDTPTALGQNPESGLWFVNQDTTIEDILDTAGTVVGKDTIISLLPGLNLPDLPTNWTYEGWVIMDSDTLSTGKFTSAVGADQSSIYSSDQGPGYAYPGEDFFNNAPPGLTFPTDLSGRQFFITVEPNYPPCSNKPYTLIPFITTIPNDAKPKMNYHMDKNTESFPGGELVLEIIIYE